MTNALSSSGRTNTKKDELGSNEPSFLCVQESTIVSSEVDSIARHILNLLYLREVSSPIENNDSWSLMFDEFSELLQDINYQKLADESNYKENFNVKNDYLNNNIDNLRISDINEKIVARLVLMLSSQGLNLSDLVQRPENEGGSYNFELEITKPFLSGDFSQLKELICKKGFDEYFNVESIEEKRKVLLNIKQTLRIYAIIIYEVSKNKGNAKHVSDFINFLDVNYATFSEKTTHELEIRLQGGSGPKNDVGNYIIEVDIEFSFLASYFSYVIDYGSFTNQNDLDSHCDERIAALNNKVKWLEKIKGKNELDNSSSSRLEFLMKMKKTLAIRIMLGKFNAYDLQDFHLSEDDELNRFLLGVRFIKDFNEKFKSNYASFEEILDNFILELEKDDFLESYEKEYFFIKDMYYVVEFADEKLCSKITKIGKLLRVKERDIYRGWKGQYGNLSGIEVFVDRIVSSIDTKVGLRDKILLEKERRLKEQAIELQEANKRSLIDPLTGAKNRGAFDIDLRSALADLKRAEFDLEKGKKTTDNIERDLVPKTLIWIDIDHFKDLNDTYGHPFGDKVLQNLVDLLSKCVREVDKVYRCGGEEFAMIASCPDRKGVVTLCGKIQTLIRGGLCNSAVYNGEYKSSDPVTVSMGVTSIKAINDGILSDEELQQELDGIVAIADKALYKSKNGGRDRFHLCINGEYIEYSQDT